MEKEAVEEILSYLKEMAATITLKNELELKSMKADLDKYVADITDKIPEQTKALMNREFDKCTTCAREWICVYLDSTFHPDVKEDILREETTDFFFSMNEKIVSVQKNFFLLGMLSEILHPGKGLSEKQKDAKIANARIKHLAREQDITARCSYQDGRRLWFFGDETNFLQSSEEGLSDDEALDYLLG